MRIVDLQIPASEFAVCGIGRSDDGVERVIADLRRRRHNHLEAGGERFIFMREGDLRACGRDLPARGRVQRDGRLRRTLAAVGHGDVHFALDGLGGGGNHRQIGRDPHGKRRDHVQLHALVAEINVLHVAIFDGQFLGELDIASFDVKGGAKRRGGERHSERHGGIEDLDGLIFGVLPIIVIEVRRGELRILGNVHLREAGVRSVFIGDGRGTIARPVEAGDLDRGHRDIRCAVIGCLQS